jgi:YbgC/YbaW family acyl-CoA thioester hydrolase
MEYQNQGDQQKQLPSRATDLLPTHRDHVRAKNVRNGTLNSNLIGNLKSAMPSNIRTEVQVMFFDTDCGGVVSNIAYLRFIEIARTYLAEALGLKLAEMAEKQTYPVVVRTEIDYRRAAKLGNRLAIEGWLDRVERARFWCAFRITRPEDDTLIAECRQMLALIEMPTGKLLRVPEHWKVDSKTASSQQVEAGSQTGTVSGGECEQ